MAPLLRWRHVRMKKRRRTFREAIVVGEERPAPEHFKGPGRRLPLDHKKFIAPRGVRGDEGGRRDDVEVAVAAFGIIKIVLT